MDALNTDLAREKIYYKINDQRACTKFKMLYVKRTRLLDLHRYRNFKLLTMKKLQFLFLFLMYQSILPQHTFSIVAIDSLTGEIGSAGATCLDARFLNGLPGALIISDVIPGFGVIHTQALWNRNNQQNARLRLEQGNSPAEVISWLRDNDVENNPSVRQYGIVSFDENRNVRSAAFTGVNCLDVKGHITGTYYAIQGNILSGLDILDSMEARFLHASGPLSDRLMASLQAAKVAGADIRCLNEGVSSQSAFIRVARPEDLPTDLYLDINVGFTPVGYDPLDSLQIKYNQWKAVATTTSERLPDPAVVLYQPVNSDWISIQIDQDFEALLPLKVSICNIQGKYVIQEQLKHTSWKLDMSGLQKGIYILTITNHHQKLLVRKFLFG